jgi:hypothetical protein
MKYLFYVIIFCLLTGCSDIKRETFDTYIDLKKSGYIAKGWVPNCFPTNTCQIIEEHDLDTNKIWIEASFLGDRVIFSRELKQVDLDDLFSDFRKRLRVNNDFSFYRLGNREAVAIDYDARKLYYYRDSY